MSPWFFLFVPIAAPDPLGHLAREVRQNDVGARPANRKQRFPHGLVPIQPTWAKAAQSALYSPLTW